MSELYTLAHKAIRRGEPGFTSEGNAALKSAFGSIEAVNPGGPFLLKVPRLNLEEYLDDDDGRVSFSFYSKLHQQPLDRVPFTEPERISPIHVPEEQQGKFRPGAYTGPPRMAPPQVATIYDFFE